MRLSVRFLVAGLLLSVLVCSVNAAASRYRWKKGIVTLSVSSSLTSNTANIAAGSDAGAALDRSIASWQQVANISFRKVSTADQNISPAGVQGDGISLITIAATPENLAMFPQGLEDATARTRVFYDARGFITEADVVLNPYLQFSTDGTVGTFDLESTITHELGHLLGLGHSPVFGATMSEGHGRNGVFNLPAFAARTLAADDIAAVRSIYGPAQKDDDCCGRVWGKLTLPSGKAAAGFTVWVEDADDGRVLAATTSSQDGSYRIGGLPAGRVELFAQSDIDDLNNSAAGDVGEITISARQPVILNKKLENVNTDFKPEYMGFNGQLASLSLFINSGNTYDIWLGGTDLKHGNIEVGSDSIWISTQRKPSFGNFGNNITTLGFYAAVAPDAPNGEYNLFVQNETGARRYLIGGLTVEKFPNFWSIAAFK